MLVSHDRAKELGRTPFGDPNAHILDRLMATFYLHGETAVLDDCITSLDSRAAEAVTSQVVSVDFGSVEGGIATA
jgi:hypothetical protein